MLNSLDTNSLFKQIIEKAKQEKIFKNMDLIKQIERFASPKFIINQEFYWLVEDKNMFNLLNDINFNLINKIASELYLDDITIKLLNNNEEIEQLLASQKTEIKEAQYLDKNLTFDNYILGDFNKIPIQVFKKLLENPSEGKVIFLFSNTGLGKTHLVSAFANEFLRKYPNKKVKYIEAVKFMKETVSLIYNSSKLEEFKDICSNYDVFILEDIQFLSSKDKTNEIFFNIYNNLVANKKIVILTSDVFPEHLVGFPERLISRFSSDLILNIKLPDSNVLKEIFVKEADRKNLKLKDEAIDIIVNYYYKDIRKMLGTINNLLMYSMMNDEEIIFDKKDIKEILNLNNIGMNNSRVELHLNPNSIINAVAEIYSIKPTDIIGPSRKTNVVNARHMCVYLMKKRLLLSLQTIGSYLGHRNHATIISSDKKFNEMLKNDPELMNLVNKVMKKLC